MKKKNRLAIVQVRWLGSASSGGWADRQTSGPVVCESVGFLIEDKPKHITVSTSVHDGNPGRYHSPMSIPRVAILKLRRIN